MLFKEYLGHRKSTREYSSKSVEGKILEDLKEYIIQIEALYKDGDIKFSFFKEGEKIFEKLDGYAGYSGVMIKAPHYLGLNINSKDDEVLMRASYSMQAILKKAYDFGLGTCWVDVNGVPDYIAAGVFDEGKPDYLIAVGAPKKEHMTDKGEFRYAGGGSDVRNDPYSGKVIKKGHTSGSRKGIEEIVYLNEYGKKMSIEDVEQRGLEEIFFLVRNAPSTKNSQPWRFIIKGSKVLLAIVNPTDKKNIIDAGIMMYFFEGMAHDMGIRGEWTYLTEEIKKHEEEEYLVVGEFGV